MLVKWNPYTELERTVNGLFDRRLGYVLFGTIEMLKLLFGSQGSMCMKTKTIWRLKRNCPVLI